MRFALRRRLVQLLPASSVLVVLAALGSHCAVDSTADVADVESDGGSPEANAVPPSFSAQSRAGMCMPVETGKHPQQVESLEYSTYSCGCPAAKNPITGAVGRLFAGGSVVSIADRVILEDAVNGDAYEWQGAGATHPNDWMRIGSSARTYAYGGTHGAPALYRLSGDGREEAQSLAAGKIGDQWERIGQGVASGIFTLNGDVFTPGYAYSGSPASSALTLWQLSDASTLVWKEIDGIVNAGQAASYVGNDSGIYKLGRIGASAQAIYRYVPGSGWSVIGPSTTGTLYAAGGTVFTVTTSGASSVVQRYSGVPNVWNDVSPGGVVSKIVGTVSSVFAVRANSIDQLDPATNRWTTVRSGSDTNDVAAAGKGIFATTKAGNVLAFSNNQWTDISCKGSVSTAGCADSCEPGPDLRGVAPAYADAPHATQVSAANARHDVLTQHNDNARSGAMTSEDVLTPANVGTPGQFGYLGTVTVPGKIVAQPLYVEKAAVVCDATPGVVSNLDTAYVVTLDNRVAAIDLEHKSVCWIEKTPLGCPQSVYAAGCDRSDKDNSCLNNFGLGVSGAHVGIVSTPVIDVVKSVMYLVTRVRDGNDARGRFFVNVIDIRTGQAITRTEIVGDGQGGRSDCGTDGFRPSMNVNRAGLLLQNDTLFVAFSMSGGEDPKDRYHGSVMAFDVSSPAHVVERNSSFCVTPTTAGGGIWMAGGGLASDGNGAFFTTGNGAYAHDLDGGQISSITAIRDQPLPNEYASSFVRLDVATMKANGFTDTRKPGEAGLSALYDIVDAPPGVNGQVRSIYWGRERADADFGSGGVALIGHSAIGGGKDGRLYVLDSTTLAMKSSFQAFLDLGNIGVNYQYRTQYYAGPHIHGGPVIWNRSSSTDPDAYVYAWSEKDHLRMFRYDTVRDRMEPDEVVDATAQNPFPTAHGDIVSREDSMPGGMLSVSSNGAQNGIIWATVEEPFQECGPSAPHCNVISGEVAGRLYAFDAKPDAQNRLKRLWGDTSALHPNNAIARYSKFAPPTIAHGRVLVPTMTGDLLIYGATSVTPPRRFAGLAAGWNNANQTSVAMYPSTGTSFGYWSQWMTTPGGYDDRSIWLPGDFDGDGLSDIATVWNDAGTAAIALRRSTGTSFVFGVLPHTAVPFDNAVPPTKMHWVSGDFDGDGKTDVAGAYECGGSTCLSVWNTTSYVPGFPPPGVAPTLSQGLSWITGTTPWDSQSQWVSGDFDGDGKCDIAVIGGGMAITVHRSLGNRFVSSSWLANAGGYEPSTQWFGGDFDGNGYSDLAAVWNNAGATSVAVYPSTGIRFNGNTQWITSPGWDPSAQWTAGDFDGDGATDLATVWNSGVNTIAMRRSTRTSFVASTWMTNAGGFSPTTRWVSGTFVPPSP